MSGVIDGIQSLIDRGGVVMWPLLALSVISVALILERSWFWFATNRPSVLRRVARMSENLARGKQDSLDALKGDRSVYALVARRLVKKGTGDAASLAAVEAFRPQLERFMVTLSTIITAAPLLGILGTVLGIIDSFDLLGRDETLSDPRTVSAGIAEALLTTAVGLTVALVTLFPYMIFRGQVDRTFGRLEGVIAAAQEWAAKQGVTETAAPPARTTTGGAAV